MPTIEWNRGWTQNLSSYMRGEISGNHYGDQWGDPELREDLIKFRKRFIHPFINEQHRALEVGSGGGRWTQYLLPFKEVICVELNPTMFNYLIDRFEEANHLQYITSHGSDIPFVPAEYVDFAMTFGVFVHLDICIIEEYLKSVHFTLKRGGQFVMQFSNKEKPSAANNPDFSDNGPEKMSSLLLENGYVINDIDDEIMEHSSIIRAEKK